MNGQLDLFDDPLDCHECPDARFWKGCSVCECLKAWPERVNRYLAPIQGCQEMRRRVEESRETHRRMKRYEEYQNQ